ncbi:MAG: LysM peptidoglycan-binding domain-containing protein [Paramuribaculum sp.]|nr:LysM peptidoglycan-binding domain-containing protein [Paramuribaculum sp.]
MKHYMFGAFLFAASSILASGLTELPVKTVNGISYHYYTVKQHETLYALSKRFNISETDILSFNPSAADGLKTGQDILLGRASKKADAANPDTYVVKKSDTAYGISKRFNMTLEEFYALNPATRDGVKEGQTIVLKNDRRTAAKAVENDKNNNTATTGNPKRVTHVIAEHETLYQIARDNNVALADLLGANPGLDAARYSAGTEIIIPVSAKSTHTPASASTSYTVKAGDTFYGIATRHGIDLPQLYAANPGIDILKEGMTITLPQSCDESAAPIAEAAPPTEKKPINIAVVLPFQIEQKGKHNKSMTEFYRGFLMAVDSLRTFGNPIHIQTYDTKGTPEGLQEILDKPDLKNAQAIIGPDNAEQLSSINAFGLENKIYVLNIFNNRDSAYLTNPYAIQAAVPRELMYDRAANSFITSFDDFMPVFIVSSDGRRDKVEFIDVMKEKLNAAGKSYKEINYNGTLALETLAAALPSDKKIAFLPGSSNKEEFDRFATALQAYKDTRDFKNEVIVWGYPEWLANRQAYPRMHDLDCYVYSRNNLPEKYETESVNHLYDTWFGPHMLQNYPQRAYMGLDAGMFLLKNLQANGGDFSGFSPYVPTLVMPISLKKVNGGGFCNNELLLINLAPGETISKRSI